MFVGRAEELSELQSWWERPLAGPALVWGRRRVGKTALLQHFAGRTGAPVVFHTATGEAPQAEMAALGRRAAAALPGGTLALASEPYRSWGDILDYLARSAQASPVLLVLDEFPALLGPSPALPGELRAFLDQAYGHTRLKIILSGSAIRAVESMSRPQSPLHEHLALNLELQPLRPHEAALMLPGLAPSDRARVYGVCGGTPLYLSWWDQRASLADNLLRLAARPGAPLLTEGQLVVAADVGEGEQAVAVLAAIAAGHTRHGAIKDLVGIDPSRTLDRLIELRTVERLLPVTALGTRSRRRVYRISDNYLSFYLGTVLRFRAEIERGLGASVVGPMAAWADEHMGPVYKEAFRGHLRRLAATGVFGPGVVAVGSWWNEDSEPQIDAVVLADHGAGHIPVLAGESTWAGTIDARAAKVGLARKSASIVSAADPLRYAVCARDHVDRPDGDTLAVTAGDIFG